MRNFSLRNTVWRNRGHEFDWLAGNIFAPDKNYIVVGNKKENELFLMQMDKPFINRSFMLSEDEEIGFKENKIIICTAWDREEYDRTVRKYSKLGYVENETLFPFEVFKILYDVYVNDKIKLDRIEIFLTSCCTLNCEKCIAFIPYYKKPKIVPLQQLKDDADILFEKVDYVGKLKILGGEGLLYPYLIEYVDYLHSNYEEKIGSIRIGTNGTVFPNEAVLEMCRKCKVILDISDYTCAVPNMCMLDDVKEICKAHEVGVDIKRTDEQWLDMGFPNNLPKEKTQEELNEHFYKCAMFCRQFSKGKYYFCCSNFSAICAELFPEDENDYFDFNKKFTKKELMEYELGYSRLGHTTFCGVCRGCSEEANDMHIPVARQINR
ncbi:MAG: radical SAM protein [Lachnospiraceae bacterium]|nr:radical SAM protein [Lachnospiraceae bacterium]